MTCKGVEAKENSCYIAETWHFKGIWLRPMGLPNYATTKEGIPYKMDQLDHLHFSHFNFKGAA